MPSPGLRRLTITLTIVVIVSHPACGLPVPHMTTVEADPGPTTDLVSQESLQVKNVESPNDLQGKDVTNKATKDKYKFSSEPKFIDTTEETTVHATKEAGNVQDTSLMDITTVQDIITKHNDVPAVTTTSTLTSISGIIAQDVKPTTGDIKKTLNGKAISWFASSANGTENLLNKPINKSDVSTLKEMKSVNVESLYNESEKNTALTISANGMDIKDIPDSHSINDQIAIDTEATENITDHKDVITNLSNEHITETTNTDIDTETNAMKTSSASFSSSDTSAEAIKPFESTTNALSSERDSTISQVFFDETSNSASTIVEVKVTDNSSFITTEPTSKKYTTIERKRTSSEETFLSTEKEKDLVKAESIQTTLPIPSLEILRVDMLSNANQLSTVRETQTQSATVGPEIKPTLETIDSTQSETLGTVASRRGGFLDLSQRTSARQATITEKNTNYGTMHEKEAKDEEIHEIKKISGYESQSQLAEDAMKEELLKEEIISYNEDAKRYENGQDVLKVNSVESNKSQVISDDALSVQPINQDRRTTLYTVGPNYKPMKRIEVQPAKPFVRDPDDNSWRNESISSLGIVFKPKNSSSKSFKEVLKTKTEIELNNLQDKDNKGETPELRERLEKITEVRKKKKKIDKFGEVIYTDYEEGSSAESTSTPKAETTSAVKSYSEIYTTPSTTEPDTKVTSPMTTTESQIYWKNKLATINKEDMFKDLGLDILTTAKPKKPYNLAEYYDTTDEYDADYVTLSKIDLKKFTIPLKTTLPSHTTPPMMPPTTRIEPPRFPERKPTVQYFPPTTKPQKVNVNDYDVDFERRVQSYTLKQTETPKTVVSDDLSDAVTAPVFADRQSEIRQTVKPSDFAPITPQSHEREQASMSHEPRIIEPQSFVMNDGNLNRGTYVIKHYRDFLSEAANDEDDERRPDSVAYTEPPGRAATLDDRPKTTEADYEYDTQFRKEVLDRFVDNFNQNSDRFKVEFPVLFNSSVVHRALDAEGRALASSSTFVKRLHGPAAPTPRARAACEPACARLTVELSPAYELHYYVPEQEERQEAEQAPATLPYRYNL